VAGVFPKTRAFLWKKGRLLLLDQRLLPQRVRWVSCRRWEEVARAIRDMVVRGAPAIGCVAAYGVVLAARQKALPKAYEGLLAARPTAVNLRWALERMRHVADVSQDIEREAKAIEDEDRRANRKMGEFGAELLPSEAVMLTHCNTGSLATAGLGTAFGVLWTAHKQGKLKKVIASETRPYLQGARLTAWELKQEKIPFELITDNMAAHVMKTEKIDGVIVGADRVAANGDTANKIGTYSLAVLARHHGIPFYVAAPISTIDLRTPSGTGIPIEERSTREVTEIRGQAIAPKNIKARHPAFDVTPASYITAIITERGAVSAPYVESLCEICNSVPLAVI
jgi:methylthioribose-1-phosphate isomerase